MESDAKIVGEAGCQIVVGNGATPVKTGFAAFGCTVRVTDTKIMSVSEKDSTDDTPTPVTTESWENINLVVSEYIAFSSPITSITLNGALDSVTLWLVPLMKP